MAWSTSDRAARLPRDWSRRKAEVKRRDKGRCQAETHEPGCTGQGTEVDHITPGDDHRLANLQLLSEPCHRAKTARESAARNRDRAARRRRPHELHPGAIATTNLASGC